MFTLDASVWVNGYSPRERGYFESHRFCEALIERRYPVVMPWLAQAEVAAAIARVRNDPVAAEEAVQRFERLAVLRWLPVDRSLALAAKSVAIATRLKANDAIYAAIAELHGTVLVSLDREHQSRVPPSIIVMTPHDAFSLLKT